MQQNTVLDQLSVIEEYMQLHNIHSYIDYITVLNNIGHLFIFSTLRVNIIYSNGMVAYKNSTILKARKYTDLGSRTIKYC